VWIILFRFLLLLYPPVFCIYSRHFPAITLDYARKIGNPGPHYSTILFFFLSPFSRVRLASDPSYSGFRLRRFRLGPTICLLHYEMTNRFFNTNRGSSLYEFYRKCDNSRARQIINDEIRKFQLLILYNLNIFFNI